MIILYEHTETSFTSNGLGCLNDVLTCNVKEELNGNYELEMEYPVNGIHYSDIALRRIVLTKPNSYDQAQPFRIYSISKPINGIVTINAEHISYDMSGYPVKGAVEHYAWYVKEVFDHIRNNSVYSFPFEFSSDITEEKKDIILSKPRSARSYLGTEEGLLSLFGGEWEFDRFKAILHKQRGTNRGVSIEYGKNLIDVTQDEKCSEMYTAVYPFYYKEDDGLQYLDENVVPIITSSYVKTLTLDLTSEFEEMPTQEVLREKTKEYIKKNKLDEPEVSLKVSFVKNPEVIESLQDVRLGDTVGVKFVKIGVNSLARCISYEFNSITEQYNSIELGEPTKTIVDTMTSTNQKLSEEEQRAKEAEEKLKTLVNVNTGAIELEVQRATAAEGTLSGRIDITDSNIDLEVQRATAAEGDLSSRISLTADTITAEVQRAMGAEGTLRSSINVASNAITAEVTRATTAEETISASLDLKIDNTDDGKIISLINGSANKIHFNATNMFTVDSPNFSIDDNGNVDMSGKVNATSGQIGNFGITSNGLEWGGWSWNGSGYEWKNYGTKIWANTIATSVIYPTDNGTNLFLGDYWNNITDLKKNVDIVGKTIRLNGDSVLVNNKAVSLSGHTHSSVDRAEKCGLSSYYVHVSSNNNFIPSNTSMACGTTSNPFKVGYSSNGWNKTSDKRLKKDFVLLNADRRFEDMFYLIEPTYYRLKRDDKIGHVGFIAQNIEQAMHQCNIREDEFYGFHHEYADMSEFDTHDQYVEFLNRNEGNNDTYTLCYEEFIALNTHMIQKQHAEIEELKQVNLSLLNRLSTLEMKMEVI